MFSKFWQGGLQMQRWVIAVASHTRLKSWINHRYDSTKAKGWRRKLNVSCGSSGVHFFMLSKLGALRHFDRIGESEVCVFCECYV